MTTGEHSDPEHHAAPTTDAGDLRAWLATVEVAIRGERDAPVPCGTCTACCRSAQFVHIEPDETDTIAHIPAELLFPAPRRPKGHYVLGYDEHGCCPMLGDDGCRIYEHRPRTCRTYDCRVFAAAGIDPGDHQPLLAERVQRWRFNRGTEGPEAAALRTAVDELAAGRAGDVPRTPLELAVRAIELHRSYLTGPTEG